MVVSFNGTLTYRSSMSKEESVEGSQSLRDVCFDVPLDRILIESGAPECRPRADCSASYDPRLDDEVFYTEAASLAGEKSKSSRSKTGKGRNVPSLPRHVPLIAAVIARERDALGVTLAGVLEASRKNASRVFGVR